MQQTTTFWNKIAEKYARTPIEDVPAYEYSLERTKSYLTEKDHVLELGCGTGSTALTLAPNVKKITASDLADNMIRIAKDKAREQQVDNVEFVVADVFSPAINQTPYDVVMALNLIHLLKDTKAVMQRAHEQVKPGGLFISKTVLRPGKNAKLKFKIMLMVLPLLQWLGKAPFVKFMETPELEGHVMEAGFEIIETGNYPATSRYIVARKPA